MTATQITAHMIVKNEDQWVWFAIQSILPYVDKFLITDTGSTDHTVAVIKSIKSSKIQLTQTTANTPAEVTAIRSQQLDLTTTSWIWIVDGDEVYPDNTAKECLAAIKSDRYEGIVVRRFDLLGDVYHRQIESVGSYNLFGHHGHLLVRLVNKTKIKGLAYQGDYPNEGFYDGQGYSILSHDPKEWYITQTYLYHAMYLKRSSMGGNLPMFNRSKYKIERGINIEGSLPEVFKLPRPDLVPDPLVHRSMLYEALAYIITPIKQTKRFLSSKILNLNSKKL